MIFIHRYKHEDYVRQLIEEWKRWSKGEGVTMQSPTMALTDEDIAEREANADRPPTPPTRFEDAEKTGRALMEIERQRPGQGVALKHYHLVSTSAVSIARRIKCSRNRVDEILRIAHAEFLYFRSRS